MVLVGLMVRLHRHTKFFDALQSMERKHSKCILTCLNCNKPYKINVCHSDIHKHVSYKNGIDTTRFCIYRLTLKFFDPMRGRLLKSIFTLH